MKLFEPYNLQARILPAFLWLLPIAVVANLAAASFGVEIALPITIMNLTFVVMLFLASSIVRHIGRNQEKKLFKKWNGPPTTRFLRSSNDEFNKYNRERIMRFCKMRFNKLELPSAKDDQAEEDKKIEAIVYELRAITRDSKKFSLLQAENCNYGMWRNLWAIKWSAVIVNVTLAVIAIMCWYFEVLNTATLIVSSATALLLILGWISLITTRKIKIVADQYANKLFETCSLLVSDHESIKRR
jgi:hypothetical protein